MALLKLFSVTDTELKSGFRTLTAVAPKTHKRKHRRLKRPKMKHRRKELPRHQKFSPLKFQGITVGRRRKRSLWEPHHESAAHIWTRFREKLRHPQSDRDPDPGILVDFQESEEGDDSWVVPSDQARQFRSHHHRKYITPNLTHSGRKSDTLACKRCKRS